MQDAVPVVEVLAGDGLVEAPVLLDVAPDLGLHNLLAREDVECVAGDDEKHDEHDRHRAPHDEESETEAADEIAGDGLRT